MITNTSAPQVVDPSPLSPKVARPKKLAKGDLDSNHTNQLVFTTSKILDT
jgi:hypothetical protein